MKVRIETMTVWLNIKSTPKTGISMSVMWTENGTPQALWIVTDKKLSFPDGTEVQVLAPNTATWEETVDTEKVQHGYRFVSWDADAGNRIRTIVPTGTEEAPTVITATYDEQLYFPTRHHARRSDKFEGKVDEEVYGLRTTALKPMMVEQQESTTAQQARLEELVGNYVHAQGLYGIELHHYRNFSQELYGLSRLFKQETLNKEASVKAQKWYERLGKTPEVKQHLEAIAKLFGITITWV